MILHRLFSVMCVLGALTSPAIFSNDGSDNADDAASAYVDQNTSPNNEGDDHDQPVGDDPAASDHDHELTLQDAITILENDDRRKELVSALKGMSQASSSDSQNLVFVSTFHSVKDFLKSIGAEFKVFTKGVLHPSSWSVKFNQKNWTWFKKKGGINLIYMVLTAFFVQLALALSLRGAIPPFYGRLGYDVSSKCLMRTIIPVVAFWGVAQLTKPYFVAVPSMQVIANNVILMILIAQLVLIFVKFTMATGIIPVDDENKRSFYAVVVAAALGWASYGIGSKLMTFSRSADTKALLQLLWVGVTVITVWVVHYYHHVIEGMLFRKLATAENRILQGVHQAISGTVHYAIMFAIVVTYLAWFVGNMPLFYYFRDQLFITIGVLFLVSTVSYMITTWSSRVTADLPKGDKLGSLTHRVMDGVAIIAVMYILYRWVAPLLAMQGIATENLSDKLFGIAVVIGLAVLLSHTLNKLFASTFIQKSNQKLKTFIPILDRLSKLVVFIIATLLILNEIGINVLPIVASFSVLGLGIGLASKTIIEDFINGLFLLQENDFIIGDRITVGGVSGIVENITLRKLHLRDNKGNLNFIPFSSVGTIINESRDYSVDKVLVPLHSTFNLKRTITILEDVGQQLLHNPKLKHYVLAAPKFVGIDDFQLSIHPNSEVATMMQFEIKTQPGKWREVAAEFRKLVKLTFDEMHRVM